MATPEELDDLIADARKFLVNVEPGKSIHGDPEKMLLRSIACTLLVIAHCQKVMAGY